MVSTVKSRPNHYEMLGISPDASSAEIAEAFAKELGMLRPRAFGTLAEVTVAYETLRNPINRKAYDTSLDLRSDPPAHSPQAPPEWVPFLVRASAKRVERPAIAPLPPPPPARSQVQRAEPRLEPRMAPSVTALLRDPVRPVARQSRLPEAVEEPKVAQPKIEPRAGGGHPLHLAEVDEAHEAEDASTEWKLPALAAGALVLAIGLGAWMGLEAGNDDESARLTQAATLKVPQAKAVRAPTDDASAPSVNESQPTPATKPIASTVPAPAAPSPVAAKQEAEPGPAQQKEGEQIATEEIGLETPSIGTASANMPLSNAVIARTLGRIGYSCGQVASTTPIQGSAAGVFKVTCTSGHSYRAAPVRGRYHFRRLGGR